MCFGTIRCDEMWPQWSHDRHNRDWRRPRTWPSLMSSPVVLARAGCTHVLLHMLGGPSSPRRVVLSTVALSNESCCTSTAPSPAWWRRWGHAESSSLSRSPPRCPACSHSPAAFSSAGSGETCWGQLHIVDVDEKNDFFFLEKCLSGNTLGGTLVCVQLRKGPMAEHWRSRNTPVELSPVGYQQGLFMTS